MSDWIIERATVQPEILRLRPAHRVEEGEAGDVSVAAGGDELDLAVQQLLLGIEHVEHVPGADRLLGAGALECELVGGDGNLVRLDGSLPSPRARSRRRRGCGR
jgi:hypothetical protein